LGGSMRLAAAPGFAARATGVRHEPHLVEVTRPGGVADVAECVTVAMTQLAPVLELDSQFEGRLRCAHNLALVEPKQHLEGAKCRDRRFADANGPDVVGLHERDVEQGTELLCQRRGRGPAGRAASGDDDTLDVLARYWRRHRFSRFSRYARRRRALISSRGPRLPCASDGRCSPARSGGPNT